MKIIDKAEDIYDHIKFSIISCNIHDKELTYSNVTYYQVLKDGKSIVVFANEKD